jgi:hypothetical protein
MINFAAVLMATGFLVANCQMPIAMLNRKIPYDQARVCVTIFTTLASNQTANGCEEHESQDQDEEHSEEQDG